MTIRLFGLMFIGLSSLAEATWSVENLHPGGNVHSECWATDGFTQGGLVADNGGTWNGSANTWVSLQQGSRINGMRDGVQVGYVVVGGNSHASLWSGSLGSWVDLHPGSVLNSLTLGVDGGTQVGRFVGIQNSSVACKWSGTAASCVSLFAPGLVATVAYGISGGQIVGQGSTNGFLRAGYWSGAADVWTSLHPPGANSSSARAVHNGTQVGFVNLGNGNEACLWKGSASSVRSLSPVGSTDSIASAVYENIQAGSVLLGGRYRASVWSGSRESWEELPLPSTGAWSDAFVTGIWGDSASISVVGFAREGSYNRALLWTQVRSIVPPSSFSVLTGTLQGGGLAEMLTSDNTYMRVQPSFVGARVDPNVLVETTHPCPVASPSSLIFTAELNATAGPNDFKLQALNNATGLWEDLATGVTNTTDTTYSQTVSTSTSRFISAGVVKVRCWIRAQSINGSRSWEAQHDQVTVEVRP
ncbi:MAG: hypothetical protein ABL949_11145 [Fimbriimonadaceae bacterium]